MNPVTQYALAVTEGTEPACKFVKQACQRHLSDLTRSNLRFDPDFVDLCFAFLSLCRHHKGEFAGKPLELSMAQKFIVGSIFGWRNVDSNLRRFRTVYIELPRKNGKSTLLSGVALLLLIADNESGAEIYSAATKEDQAKIVWGDAREMIRKSTSLSRATKVLHNSITFPALGGVFRPLGADSKTLDGLNPHGVICDELHAWPNRGLWDVLEDAFGARAQPLMIAITTAGADRNGIAYEQRQHVLQVIDPGSDIEDDSYFGYVATVDEEDKTGPLWWMNEDVWKKANPLLGIAKRVDYMRDIAAKAQAMPGKLNAFLNKQLNVWTDGQSLMWNVAKWDECNGEIELELLAGRQCFAGLDLSTNIDITALVFLFPPGPYPEWSIYPRFYIPEENLREAEKRDKVPYRKWVDQGLIDTTPGDFIDLEFIKKDFIDLSGYFQVKECGYDPWRGTEIATALENEGATMVLMRQGHPTLTPAVNALEKKIAKLEVRHGGNPVLRWMISNCTGREDPNKNVIPDKKNSFSRIDGVSALLNALGRAIVAGADKESAYQEREVMFL